jgi:hypothetical protein
MLERGALPGDLPLDDLVAHFRAHFSDEANRGEVLGTRIGDIAHVASDVMGRYIVDNPVNAWIGGNTGLPSPWFTFDPGQARLRYTGPQPEHRQCFLDAVEERVAYRLTQYRQRRYASGRHVKVVPNGASACIMLGNDASDGLPRGSGWQLIRSGDEYFYAKFASIAVNVIKRRPVDSNDEPNLIVDVLTTLFNDVDLLQFNRAYRMTIVKAAGEDAWRMVAM